MGVVYCSILYKTEPINQSPFHIEIDNYEQRAHSVPDIRDKETIKALLSMLVQHSDFETEHPRGLRPQYGIMIPPSGKSTYTRSPLSVWRLPDGLFIWSDKQNTYQLHGDLDQFIKCTRARRIAQLLTSKEVEEQVLGQELRGIYQEALLHAIDNLNKSKNMQLQHYAEAIRASFETAMPDPLKYLQGKSPGAYTFPRDRKGVTRDQMEILEGSFAELAKNMTSKHYNDASIIINNMHYRDDPTVIEAAIALLNKYPGSQLSHELTCAVTRYYCLPEPERLAVCGNSTEEELKKNRSAI